MDNLNTHNIASLYEAFSPKEALSLAKRLEIHYTPKHGSWLNIAEIEFLHLAVNALVVYVLTHTRTKPRSWPPGLWTYPEAKRGSIGSLYR
jgi:hypothetical protein